MPRQLMMLAILAVISVGSAGCASVDPIVRAEQMMIEGDQLREMQKEWRGPW